MVQFVWSAQRRGWVPEWLLGSFDFLTTSVGEEPRPLQSDEGLQAMSIGGDRLWLFRNIRGNKPAVEARDLATMEELGRWRLPYGLPALAGACAWDGSSALALAESGAPSDGPPPRLVRLTFPPT